MTVVSTLLAATGGSHFRVDSFVVPAPVRDEVEAAMRRNLGVIETQPGFQGHLVLERTGGPTEINLVTLAAWESAEALDAAGVAVREVYRRIGFDPAASLRRWGVRAELGDFRLVGASRGRP